MKVSGMKRQEGRDSPSSPIVSKDTQTDQLLHSEREEDKKRLTYL
jgi:hypothetical protein